MNNDMLPVGTTLHINPEDIKWEQKGGDLISREALKKAIYNDLGLGDEENGSDAEYMSGLQDCYNLIDNAPTELFPLTVKINNNVTDEDIETLKRLMADYTPQILNLETEKPQGEWLKVKEERMSVDMSGEIVTRYKCSKCGRVIATFPSKLADYYPFCHCGADMRTGGEK